MPEGQAYALAGIAEVLAAVGEVTAARQAVAEALALSQTWWVLTRIAPALAAAGDGGRAATERSVAFVEVEFASRAVTHSWTSFVGSVPKATFSGVRRRHAAPGMTTLAIAGR